MALHGYMGHTHTIKYKGLSRLINTNYIVHKYDLITPGMSLLLKLVKIVLPKVVWVSRSRTRKLKFFQSS